MDDRGTSSSVNMSISLPPPRDSPDSSSPSSSYRPFSNLPTELVQTIIESTVAHHYHSTTYTTRQATLRSLCLVCRLFRRIASPLLCSIVHVPNRSAMDSWLAQNPTEEEARRPVELVVSNIEVGRVVDPSIIQYPSLRLLAVDGSPHVMDLCVLAILPNLEVLRLSDVSIENSHDEQLPTIVELQLLRVYAVNFPNRILTPKAFPGLRCFSYSDEDYDADGTLTQALDVLGPQLDALSLDAEMISELSEETLQSINEFTLFDLDANTESLPIACNIRIIGIEHHRGLAQTLEFISDSLPQNAPSSHRLLYLPDTNLDWSSGNLKDELRRLTSVCGEKGVEIVREEQPGSWMSDAWISSDFWRRMRGEKRKKP